jgi:DNA polymerase-1
VRKIFVAEDGYALFCADYSMMEYAMVAHQSEDPALLASFMLGEDLHTAAAMLCLGDPNRRSEGKTINFFMLFGGGAPALGKKLGNEFKGKCWQIHDRFFARFPKVKQWQIRTKEDCQMGGWVQTLHGRERNIKEATKGNNRSIAAMALNTPVQGSCADLVKLAMIRWDEIKRAKGFKTSLILQVHDELIWETPKDEVEIVEPYIKGVMESIGIADRVVLRVPMRVDVEARNSWGD